MVVFTQAIDPELLCLLGRGVRIHDVGIGVEGVRGLGFRGVGFGGLGLRVQGFGVWVDWGWGLLQWP